MMITIVILNLSFVKKYLFHRFHTIFNEEFKNQGLESLRQRFEDLLRKLDISSKTINPSISVQD